MLGLYNHWVEGLRLDGQQKCPAGHVVMKQVSSVYKVSDCCVNSISQRLLSIDQLAPLCLALLVVELNLLCSWRGVLGVGPLSYTQDP